MTAEARAETDTLRLDDGLEPSLGAVLGFRRWPATPEALADAGSQAVPFTGDVQATDRAWAARVDEAVNGLNVLDPEGLDEWMGVHAAAEAPHLLEADLVAAWDTWLATEYEPPSPLDHQPFEVLDVEDQAADLEAAGIDGSGLELAAEHEALGVDDLAEDDVDTDDDADGWP